LQELGKGVAGNHPQFLESLDSKLNIAQLT
jgi:hypothetical protein